MNNHENNFHSLGVEETLEQLNSDIKGLSREEAKSRLSARGFNELPKKKERHPALMFLRQFHSALIYILIGAAVISFLADHLADVYIILAVIIFNAVIGFVQERRAGKAIEALQKLIILYAKVYRGGELIKIKARELVLGDIMYLEEGDKAAADGRLIEIKNLKTEEAALTGESFPIEKELGILKMETVLADRKNMVFMGTSVVNGAGLAAVTATGAKTALGEVAQTIGEIKRPKTHFEKRTSQLATMMAIIAVIGAVATFAVGYFVRNLELFDIFLFSVASLVSGIPEGLPAVLVVVLAIGSWRMAKKNVIIRHLPSAETLGVVTVIATDKTGTLTQNSMMVEKILLAEKSPIDVSGDDWKPIGSFFEGSKIIRPQESPDLWKLLKIISICNSGRVFKTDDHYEIMGDPTEAALTVLGEKAGMLKDELVEEFEKYDELPFDRQNKYRAVLVGKEKREIYVVGAFENILNLSNRVLVNQKIKPITRDLSGEILKEAENLADDALRVLAVAYKEAPKRLEALSNDLIKDLTWVGLVGMMDPPRPEVKEAISKARRAGIRVIMKTGDHKNTAVAIAKIIGLIGEKDFEDGRKLVYDEEELEKLEGYEFSEAVKTASVFARVTPKMKTRIVAELQKQGEIVAMTGDGVNDAPAIKQADIGISMGVIGTDVAREASEMVLADDNFASIVNAIEEGRIVFNNVRQTSFYLVTTNMAEDVTIISSLLFGLPLPLLPVHVLWLNLITDGVSSVPLAAEPGHNDVIGEKPRKAREMILSKSIIPFWIVMVGIMATITIFLFYRYLPFGIEKARTVAFTFIALSQLFNVFNLRSLKKSIFSIGIFSNRYLIFGFLASLILQVAVIYIPFLQQVFRFKPLTILEWLMIFSLSSLVLWAGELYKFIKSRLALKQKSEIAL
ncbi:MAG: HAD-IC family P-type ATPase [bacterium]|nr:HAD-IC family P-type ATPase [bacterium]